MKLGSDNKLRTGILMTAMGLLAAYAVYSNFLSGPSTAPAPAARTGEGAATPGTGPATDAARSAPDARKRPNARGKDLEFNPKLRSNKKEEQIADLSKVDPTLRLDLLAKVMQVPPAGAERDLFQILKSPPVKQSDLAKANEPTLPRRPVGPVPPPPTPVFVPPGPPPEPPFPFKYYGFCTEHISGKKFAYFLDGEDILQATEGSTLKGRYRVVQIGLTEVFVEDTESKKRQSVHVEPEAAE